MKLTNKQRRALRLVLADVERARDYVRRDDIAVCRRGRATTTLHYVRGGDAEDALYPVATDCGSDLCGLDGAIDRLANILTNGEF